MHGFSWATHREVPIPTPRRRQEKQERVGQLAASTTADGAHGVVTAAAAEDVDGH
jgi:hypothetical protein